MTHVLLRNGKGDTTCMWFHASTMINGEFYIYTKSSVNHRNVETNTGIEEENADRKTINMIMTHRGMQIGHLRQAWKKQCQ